MRFIKFSGHEITLDRSRTYTQNVAMSDFKPSGLWFTDETEYNWEYWCRAEDFFVANLSYKHNLYIDESRLLFVRNADELKRLARAYGVKPSYSRAIGKVIDWDAIARDYAGIVISPYQWEFRLNRDYFWYYSWDCASGCVWDLSAIEHIELASVDTEAENILRIGFRESA